MGFLQVKDWTSRWCPNPKARSPWIKMEGSLLDEEWFFNLSDKRVGQLTKLLLLASKRGGYVPDNDAELKLLLNSEDDLHDVYFLEMQVVEVSTRKRAVSTIYRSYTKKGSKKEQKLPDWLSPAKWQEFRDHRVELGKPLTAVAEKRLLTKLAKLRDDGGSVGDIIQRSIDNCWLGLFQFQSRNVQREDWD